MCLSISRLNDRISASTWEVPHVFVRKVEPKHIDARLDQFGAASPGTRSRAMVATIFVRIGGKVLLSVAVMSRSPYQQTSPSSSSAEADHAGAGTKCD